MNPETHSQNPGEELGRKALADALAKADAYCTHETQRLALENQSRIAALQAELARLQDEEHRIEQRLHRALPAADAQERRRKAIYYWLVTSALTVAGFFFSLLAFDPYRLGWKSYLYCAGIALIAPFCVEKFLETWSSPKLLKTLATVACIAALTSLVLLSLVRGDVLTQEFKVAAPILILSGETPAAPAQTDFYQQTVCLLRAVMALLALAMEIGAGLALYEARRHSPSAGEDAGRVAQELQAIQQRMVAKLEELRKIENAAAVFQHQFWRDFYRALADGVSSSRALVKASAFVLAMLLALSTNVQAAEPLNLVIALDLTKSVAVGSPGQRQEFEKNIEATAHILARVPANTRITVIGITDQSFGEPLTVLDARIPADAGYFQERLTAARQALLQAWAARAKSLVPSFKRTDILGVLLLASQIFQNSPKSGKVLVIFSDMRENAGNLNLEKSKGDVHLALARAAQGRTTPDLKGVEVYVLGADNARKPMSYWTSLRDSWAEYFKRTGADLKTYTVLRELPDLR